MTIWKKSFVVFFIFSGHCSRIRECRENHWLWDTLKILQDFWDSFKSWWWPQRSWLPKKTWEGRAYFPLWISYYEKERETDRQRQKERSNQSMIIKVHLHVCIKNYNQKWSLGVNLNDTMSVHIFYSKNMHFKFFLISNLLIFLLTYR